MQRQRKLLLLSLFSSFLVILNGFFQWSIVEIITPFLMFPFWLVLFVFFIVITVLAIVQLFKYKNWKPFVIQAVTIIILFYFPFTQTMLDLDFKMHKSEREEVVDKVVSGKYKYNVPDSPSLIHLPKQYTHLSKGGGDVIAVKTGDSFTILFFTFRGILDSFSGFVYSTNDQKPLKTVFDGDFKEIKKLDKHWYFVGSY
ncbi:hypothetical protein AN964_22305 [Heyndrickxia shackletonii]|uniref:Uncharacterized protein n=1 Tax=Heyndrickxia shackletonii TaxID=157838 RepID=A0A0Q3TA44_9BACI|nr:hypothetical protein [Heyndrickxia shackletonii]KQL50401.1 hypothetical protein AN964_22305 [Heyndrickxia shackletonii]NEZ00861.1 hypothetical protein [Heyndrickxia shackletonii]